VILATFVFALVAPDSAWAASALVLIQSGMLVTVLATARIARTTSRTSVMLVGAAAIAAVANVVSGGDEGAAAVALFAGLLTLAVAVVIARGVVSQPEVNTESIRGAICIYLLLGLLFAFLFGAVASLGSTPFFVQGTDGTRALRVYFSYVTLATLGYGDYTPAGTIGHLLAVVEALAGQLYLVTVVAVLVSRLSRGEDRRRDRRPLIPPG
jgi:hypothetical protein